MSHQAHQAEGPMIPASRLRLRNALAPILLVVVLAITLVYTAWKAWEQARAYEHTTTAIIAELDTEARIEAWTRRMLEWLSLGLYEASKDPVAQLSDLKTLQQSQRASAQLMTAAFFGLAPFVVAAVLWMRRSRGDAAYALLAISLVALAVGVTAPILSIQASKSLPLIGETVLQFESKSVLSMLGSLYDGGNTALALLLFSFSVLIPLAKTLLVGLTFFARSHHWSLRGLRLTHAIGKWSMVDVFVVAVLVAFLASNGKGLTHAEVQVGLYFFAGYGVLSLVATQLIRFHLFRPDGSTAGYTEDSGDALDKLGADDNSVPDAAGQRQE